jgi:hypothetical protein
MYRWLTAGLGIVALAAMLTPQTADASPRLPHHSSCTMSMIAPPGHDATQNATCGGIGTTADAKMYYSWGVPSESSGRACVEALGYERLIGPVPPGQPPPAHEKWYSLGCGTSSDRAIGVPWGNRIAVPKIRARSMNVPLGCPVNWQVG